jgi:hypothetical protein
LEKEDVRKESAIWKNESARPIAARNSMPLQRIKTVIRLYLTPKMTFHLLIVPYLPTYSNIIAWK